MSEPQLLDDPRRVPQTMPVWQTELTPGYTWLSPTLLIAVGPWWGSTSTDWNLSGATRAGCPTRHTV